jgi:hypothetical protein
MFALFGAKFAAVGSACGRHCKLNIGALAAIVVTAGLLSACMPATVPLAGADPADQSAKVARVGYRSTIAPYTSLRPSMPTPWRQRNEGVTPQLKSDQ